MTARAKKGSGSIRKRGNRWQATADVLDLTGNRKRTSRNFATKSEAQKWINETAGTVAPSSVQTFGSYLKVWMASGEFQAKAPGTRSWYKSAIESHIDPALGKVKLAKLNATHLDTFYQSKRESGRLDGKGGLGAASVRRLHVTIHAALAHAVKKGLLVSNVADLADKPKAPAADPTLKGWTQEQLAEFLDFAADDDLFVLWHLAAWTGARRGELMGLQWSDVDLKAGRLMIRRTRVMVDGNPQDSTPKTEQGRRTVDLDAETLSLLQGLKVAQTEARLFAGPAWEDTGLLFTWNDGTPLRPDFVSRRFGKLVEASGLPKVTFHGFRHSHATALMAAGINPKVAQERLGHHDPAFTMRAYQSVSPGMQAAAVESLKAAAKAKPKR